MTLKELAKRYTKEYEFILTDINDKGNGRYERNELVLFNYAVADSEVIEYSESQIYYNTVYVKTNWERA